MSRMSFELLGTDGVARRGRLTFPRGTVETPAFMPVGTYGSVKGVLPEQVRALGAEIILGNTFHLYLRPGLEVMPVRRQRPRRIFATRRPTSPQPTINRVGRRRWAGEVQARVMGLRAQFAVSFLHRV